MTKLNCWKTAGLCAAWALSSALAAGQTVTVLANFDGTNGSNPQFVSLDGLVQGADGNFYGTVRFGGTGNACPNNCGAILKVTSQGVVTRLHSFDSTDGAYPQGGLLQATNGILYGVADEGGTYGDGTISSLGVGLGPFVETVPRFGKVGTAAKVLGNNLGSARGVTFNGVPATFTVESGTYIEATVPTGATTGPVEVTLPSGTLTSNVNFRVQP